MFPARSLACCSERVYVLHGNLAGVAEPPRVEEATENDAIDMGMYVQKHDRLEMLEEDGG
jgi:hypothetical protein